mmetsp:Transcript_98802/g.318601  ORF Transcript_98802/g.318601 Transcript_98802/m.318601 type:complete len:242 (+) Transcript_98802:406-1131(+)
MQSLRVVSAPLSSRSLSVDTAVSLLSVSRLEGAAAKLSAERFLRLTASMSTFLSNRSLTISTKSSSAAFMRDVQPWCRSSASPPCSKSCRTRASSPFSTAAQRWGFGASSCASRGGRPSSRSATSPSRLTRSGREFSRRPAPPRPCFGLRDLCFLRPSGVARRATGTGFGWSLSHAFSHGSIASVISPKLKEACIESLASSTLRDTRPRSDSSRRPSCISLSTRLSTALTSRKQSTSWAKP